MGDTSRTIYKFGPFQFDASERLLYREGGLVSLTPKVADTLLALLEHHGRCVEKAELLTLVWPDAFVEEGGLARNVSMLRKVFGDDPEGGRYIETIPKRGYRFHAPVTECKDARQPRAGSVQSLRVLEPKTSLEDRGHRARMRHWAIGAGLLLAVIAGAIYAFQRTRETEGGFHPNSIAVLPLKNGSNDPGQEYLSEGMSDLLATELKRKGVVRVIPPASLESVYPGVRPEEIVRRLNVDAIVTGRVLGSGERVEINAQLIDVRTGQLVWSKSYQRLLRDVLGLQNELADAIAAEITASVSPSSSSGQPAMRPVVPDAYHAYLKGRYLWNKRTEADLRKAVEYFNEAISKDATYAPAHAGLADCYALLGSSGYDAMPPREAMPLAKSAALKALELDSRLAEAHTSLAYVLMVYDWDFPASEKEFQRAFALNANYATAHHWHAHLLLAQGELDRAAAEMAEAQNLDPLSLAVNVGVGWSSYFARHYPEAIAQYRKTLELAPDFPLAHQTLAMALEQTGDYSAAINEFQKAVQGSGGSASTVAFLGHACARAGRKTEAQAQLAKLLEMSRSRYVPAIYTALVYLGLEDLNRAAIWLSTAREERSEYLIYYKVDPNFALVRDRSSLFPPLQPR